MSTEATSEGETKVEEEKPLVEETKVEETKDESAQKIEKLESDLAELKTKVSAPAPTHQTVPQVTSQSLATLTDEQWGDIETKTGRTRGDILNEVRYNETRGENQKIGARMAVSDALDGEIEKDPTVAKLKSGMKEYFDSIPDVEKMDAAKMTAHLVRAKRYARGVLAEKGMAVPAGGKTMEKPVVKPTPSTKPVRSVESDGGGKEGEEEGNYEEGEIKNGEYVLPEGGKIKIGKVSRKKFAEVRHGDRSPNDVRFAEKDERPVFKRGG